MTIQYNPVFVVVSILCDKVLSRGLVVRAVQHNLYYTDSDEDKEDSPMSLTNYKITYV